MSGWFNSAWFGGGGGSARNSGPKSAIIKLREQKETLEKREAYLETQIHDQEDKAKKNVTANKNVALAALRKKKTLEGELERTQKQIATLETQISSIENANINYQTLEAMKEANKAMKDMNKKHNIDKIDNLLDELDEQMTNSNQIAERIGQIGETHNQIDESELLDELRDLEQEKLDEQMLSAGAPPVSVPNGVEKQKQTAKQIEEDDEEAELRKLQAEMAM
ncbi:uncharacterized protein DFL_009425 [Arthrobotrys flagrans]|uniref:Vacuolar-sorting protein SNF7 n=1 Tax=Arthrobotrys flagrans TaxID=97331 RepID=A0A436ZRL9_ARTFL|nr:hypothetical protein DFL_009425 [Arthrobotrys flagrans]